MSVDTDPGSELARELGVTVKAREGGRAVTEMVVGPAHTNAAGVAHGGTTAALMDITMTIVAVPRETVGERLFSITLSLTTNFIAPVRQGRVRCEAVRTGGGRRTVYCEGRILDDADTLLATASCVCRLIPHPEP